MVVGKLNWKYSVTFLGVLSVSYNTLFIFKNSKPGSKSKENRADDLCIKAINRRQDLLFSRDIIDPAARVARLATTTLLLYKLSAWLACLPCPNQLCIPAWLFQQRQQGRAGQGKGRAGSLQNPHGFKQILVDSSGFAVNVEVGRISTRRSRSRR